MYSQYLNEQFELQSQQEKYPQNQNQKQKTESIPSKQNKPQPQKPNKIELPKLSSMTIDPTTQTNNITSNRQKKAISQFQNSNSRYLPKDELSQKSGSLNKRDTQYLKRDNQLAESTKLPFNSKVKSKDAAQVFGNNVDVGQFMDGKERNTNYRSLSTHFLNKNKKNALRILNRGEEQKFNEQFYHSREELQQLSIEEITMLSRRLKENIKSLDNTLSEKVAKALRQYKQGNSQPQSPQKQYILLKQTVSNNQSIWQNLSFDYLKLQSKQGQLQEQYYELQLAKEVTKTMQKIRQLKRDIIQMKKRVRTSSFQLNDSDILPKMTKKLNALKLDLFKVKQQVDKNEVKIQQCQMKKGQIQDKSYRLSQKQSSLLEQAKNKKIRLEPDLFLRKSLQLKMRIDKCKQLRSNSENHIQRATISLMNEINHLNNEIRQYQEDTKGVQTKINQIQKKAFNFIENNKSLLKNIAVSPQNSIGYFQRKWVLQEQQSKIIKPILGIKSIKEQQKRQKNQLKQISQSTQQQHTQKGEKIQTPQSDEENQFMNLTQSKIKQFTPQSKDMNSTSLPSFQESREQNQTQTAITLSRRQKSKHSPKNIQNQSIQAHQVAFPRRFRLKKQKATQEQMIGKQEAKK